MTMRTGLAGLAIIKEFEGCRLTAYRDVVGVLTIGWGDTGPDVKLGLVITQEDADRRLSERLTCEFEPGVRAAIGDAPTTQGQFDAMVSLAYNIGVWAFKESTVARRHKAADYDGAGAAFLLWNHAGGRLLAGLVRRRAEERALYLSDAAEAAASEREIDAAIRDFESKARSLQLHLKAGRYYQGAVDGDFGPLSRQALADYKTRINPT